MMAMEKAGMRRQVGDVIYRFIETDVHKSCFGCIFMHDDDGCDAAGDMCIKKDGIWVQADE